MCDADEEWCGAYVQQYQMMVVVAAGLTNYVCRRGRYMWPGGNPPNHEWVDASGRERTGDDGLFDT